MSLDGRVVLITGGSGTLGQAIAKLILTEHNPHSIRIFSRGEFFQVQMADKFQDKKLRFLIGDVRDRNRVYRAFKGVDVVIHAAALKHVPICEYNPIEAVRTNIEGSINVIEAALDNNVEKVMAVSSDKAVSPINIYGATKLAMEKLFTQANVYGSCKFSCVRLGNIIGSHGSFLEKLESCTDEVPVTHPWMTRFWITQEDAARFVLGMVNIMEGREIFVPKLEARKVSDMVKERLPKAKMKIIGIRPGEKLNEELVSHWETTQDHGDYLTVVIPE